MAERINSTERRDLTYSTDFREWLREHPGVIQAVRDVVQTLETDPVKKSKEKGVFETGAIEISVIGGGGIKDENLHYYYLKASVQGVSYFVKVQTYGNKPTMFVTGAQEYASTLVAKKRIADLPWVEVIDPLFGYQEMVNHRKSSYFVSPWKDLPTCNAYLYDLFRKHKTEDNADSIELHAKLEELKARLPDFWEVRPGNMFYDAARKKIVLYDLHHLDKRRDVADNTPE